MALWQVGLTKWVGEDEGRSGGSATLAEAEEVSAILNGKKLPVDVVDGGVFNMHLPKDLERILNHQETLSLDLMIGEDEEMVTLDVEMP